MRPAQVLACVGLAACTAGGPRPGGDGPRDSTTPAESSPGPIAIGPDAATTDVSSVVGKPAPEWELATWFNAKPLTMADLRGRVVLVRWFMSSECPYCSATAPSLVKLDADYAARGLTVVGMYHHKSDGPLVVEDVRKLVQERYAFRFPVAIDDDWKTLKRWWLDAHPESWTSVSFLVDRGGTVRFVHLGGEYAPDSGDYRQMRAWIEELLAAPR
ncbi:MAG: TlpA disulfide reductase family protein [Polyangiaceae bacterium]